MSPETSPSLLIRLRNHEDGQSWETFERIYGAIISRYCQHWNLQPNDIEDVVQEVLADVSRQIRSFKYDPAKGRFRSWLGTITVNKLKQFWKAKKSNRIVCEVQPEMDAAAPNSYWVEIYSEQILDEAIKNVRPLFEEVSWQCFAGTWIENANPIDVARILSVSIQSVYVNKSRVLKRLEQEVRFLSEDLACNKPFESSEDGS